jgi:hypothetical protein
MADSLKAVDVHAHLVPPGLLDEALSDEGMRRKVLRGNAERLFGVMA